MDGPTTTLSFGDCAIGQRAFRNVEVLVTKNDEDPERIDVVRFEKGPEDRLPEFKKGWKCVLFLKREPEGTLPAWRTTEPFFSAVGFNSELVAALTAKN